MLNFFLTLLNTFWGERLLRGTPNKAVACSAPLMALPCSSFLIGRTMTCISSIFPQGALERGWVNPL